MARPRVFAALLALFLPLIEAVRFLDFMNFTSPSPLIFHSLATLLQVQPQTLFPNGHTIASVTIPRHTLLYHGRHDKDPVPSPEWLAFDMEMAYGIMGNMQDSRLLTYRTTRNVRAVYFDGTSASLMGDGTFSQMVFLYNGTDDVPKRGGWGPPPPGREHGNHTQQQNQKGEEPPRRPPGRRPPPNWNPLHDEYFRARELCTWLQSSGLGGSGWGFEGIVRMNAGFESIWCDFNSTSLKLVSDLNISAPLNHNHKPAMDHAEVNWQQELGLEAPLTKEDYLKFRQILGNQQPVSTTVRARLGITADEGPHGPGMTDPREPFRNTSNWFWFSAAAKRYRGDERIKLNSRGVFSFYEPGLRSQSRSRIEDDVKRLNLEPAGRWKRDTYGVQLPFMPRRHEELRALMHRRRQHRLTNVDNKDGVYMRNAVEERLKASLAIEVDNDEVDWHYTARNIVIRYHNELVTLVDLLGAVPQASESNRSLSLWFYKLRQVTHWFMTPFMEYPPSRPYSKQQLKTMFSADSKLALDTLHRCTTQYDIEAEEELTTTDEFDIFNPAIRDIVHGICSTVIKIGLAVELYWFLHFNGASHAAALTTSDTYLNISRAATIWEQDLQELLAWLGWAEQWVKCEERCGVGEVCYMPMWPVAGWSRRRWDEDPEFLWEPVCVDMNSYPPEGRR